MKFKLGDLLTRVKEPVRIKSNEEYSLVTIKMYHKGVVKRADVKGSTIKSSVLYAIKPKQFILSGIDARNRAFGIVPEELNNAVVTNDFWTHEINSKIINLDYFYWLTTTPQFYEACVKASEGTTNRQRLQADKFYSFDIWLPSLNEQKIWVRKISKINEQNELLKKELIQQQSYLQQLRQAILQEAVQGKLAKQSKDDEPADKLLERINLEKANLVTEKKTKWEFPLHAKSRELPIFELPRTWKWVRFWNIAWCYRGHNPPKSEFVDHPKEGYIRFVQITDFKTEDKAIYVPKSKGLKYVKKGEIIMAAYRHIGKLSREMEGAFNVALCKIINIEPYSRDFLELVIKSNLVTGELLAASERGHIPSMHSEHLLSLWVPVPPLAEQQRIVIKVRQLTQVVNQLEQQLQQSQYQAVQLLQSVLKEAFGGMGKEYEMNDAMTMSAEGN